MSARVRFGTSIGRPGTAAVLTALVLSAVTLTFLAIPSLRFAVYAPQLDLAINTIAMIVALAVAALGEARFREAGGIGSLFEASAFLVLAAASLVSTTAIITGADASLGLTATDPGQLPLYFWAAARLLSAGLLAAGSMWPSARRIEEAGHPRVLLWLPTILLVVVSSLLWLIRAHIPVLVDPTTLRELVNESRSGSPLPGINPGILLLDGTAAGLLVAAIVGYSREGGPPTWVPRTYLVVGLVIAAFSQIHYIVYPAGAYSGLVSTGDGLRLAFYLVLAAGIQAGTRADLRRLRSANARLELMAASEADRTAIAERARLARELHDGLAQELWTTKLEFDRLVGLLGPQNASIGGQLTRVGGTLDHTLLEARDAVASLRSGFDGGLSFSDELPRRLDSFVESTGYLVDLEQDESGVRLSGVPAAEALRIVDESLHNVQKHADATRIRVRISARDGTMTVAVDDNGRGFNPSAPHTGQGIVGMRERAALLGGRLEIRSAPGDGTSIRLVLPTPGMIE